MSLQRAFGTTRPAAQFRPVEETIERSREIVREVEPRQYAAALRREAPVAQNAPLDRSANSVRSVSYEQDKVDAQRKSIRQAQRVEATNAAQINAQNLREIQSKSNVRIVATQEQQSVPASKKQFGTTRAIK